MLVRIRLWWFFNGYVVRKIYINNKAKYKLLKYSCQDFNGTGW